jgi:hypothetical protein
VRKIKLKLLTWYYYISTPQIVWASFRPIIYSFLWKNRINIFLKNNSFLQQRANNIGEKKSINKTKTQVLLWSHTSKTSFLCTLTLFIQQIKWHTKIEIWNIFLVYVLKFSNWHFLKIENWPYKILKIANWLICIFKIFL